MKITLIGDSIRMQYENKVREILGEEYEAFSPTENCRFAKYNLRGMWDWKEGMQDSRIVHFNCGLWDICDIFGDGIFTDIDEYVKTVLRVADIMLSRYERVIFATTTPVRYNNPYNDNEQIIKYNEAIVPRLREKGIIINDLHALIYKNVDKYVSDDLIHLSEEGVELAAHQVADLILKAASELSEECDIATASNDNELVGAPVKFRE